MSSPQESSRLPLTSADPLAERVARLRELFPEAAGEGKFDVEKLRALLGDGAARGPERYGLSWAGKSDALKALQTRTTATLRPAPSESMNWDVGGLWGTGGTGSAPSERDEAGTEPRPPGEARTEPRAPEPEHVIIEGDNLEVLHVLQHAYARDGGQVKLIYIDPPYNTGGDFIYPDDYAEGLGSYLTYLKQVKDGVKQTTNLDTSGRFHSRWLTMIYPRLFLARNLLREDGVIFVSIDDHEVSNLRMVMDEIFGEENFLVCLVYDKNRKNDAKFFSVGHEYMLVYARNKGHLTESGVIFRAEKEGVEEVRAVFEKLRKEHSDDWERVRAGLKAHYSAWPDDDSRQPLSRYTKVDENGPYRDDGNINWPGGGGPTYEVLHPITNKPCKLPTSGWRYPKKETMEANILKGLVVFGPDETTVPSVRNNLFDKTTKVLGSVFFSYAQTATQEFAKLFNGEKVFENPKHVGDIRKHLEYLTSGDDLILDFFAGSGTTAQAVLELNKEDGGNRRFILVQLPEPTGRADFPNIAEITKERVRRVIRRMEGGPLEGGAPSPPVDRQLELGADEAGGSGDGARPSTAAGGGGGVPPSRLGFKVFKLAESNFAIWDPALAATEPAALAEQWTLSADNVRADASETALLYELMLKSGDLAPSAS